MQMGEDVTLPKSDQLPSWAARHPRICVLVLGALSATGFPPLGWWPIALLAMGAAAALFSQAVKRREAAILGWLFGVAHFTAAHNWIATAFTHQAEMPQFLGWIAVPVLALYLGIYPALAALAARAVAGRSKPLAFALAFAGFWVVTEWLRSWLFTGYGWGPFSLILLGGDNAPGLAMLLPWFGTYALSGLAVLAACAAAYAVAAPFKRKGLSLADLGRLAIAVAFAAAMWMPLASDAEGTIRYTVVQPDLDQAELNDPRQYEPAFLTLSALTARDDDAEKRLVFWPESGMPDYLRPGYPQRYYHATTAGGDPLVARNRVGQILDANSILLTGTTDLEIQNGRAVAAYNVVTVLDTEGAIAGSYRKAHLVPYGEYLALRWLLEPLGASRLVAGTIDFWEGPGPHTLDLGAFGRPGIQICYEIVFSGQVTDRNDRPDYIFNPSNDGWFGTWGPPQHFAQARMRAIEEGLPVIRATTTGISGVIDARGVVRASLGSGKMASLNGLIPPAAAPTLFARTGNLLALLWAAFFLALSLVALRWRRS
ncbi:apolipoprotein N-acyltransferase [Altererythrobacter sp.]|nr:apolipoprotein N-acyltransferase [Altererythrobacter sp.]